MVSDGTRTATYGALKDTVNPDPNRRYKAVLYECRRDGPAGVGTATSPDGVHWTKVDEPAERNVGDIVGFFHDTRRSVYAGFIKKGTARGRARFQIESEGFVNWTEPIGRVSLVVCGWRSWNWKCLEFRCRSSNRSASLWLRSDLSDVRGNLRREATRWGVASDRVILAGREARPLHLARHSCADLFLDTLPSNAHTTAVDAVWVGLPLLTCPGHTMSRVSRPVS
jgi:hypothetical protein